jgi:uncharacterized Zn finger protein
MSSNLTCLKCGCSDGELKEISEKSLTKLVLYCTTCGGVIDSQIDNNPCEIDGIVTKFEKYLGVEKGSFKVVSMN